MLRKTLLLASALIALQVTAQQPIRVTADLTQVGRKIYSSESDIPVKAGHLALTMPKWIPGDHAPNGPIADLLDLVFTANGKTLPWRRDDVDMFEFHLDIPAGVSTLHAHIEMGAGRSSDKIAVLEWERAMIYPAHIPVAKIPIQPTVIVPAGWGIGTALTPVHPHDPNAKVGGATEFEATNVEQLEDSPVVSGEYFHEFALAPDVTPKHYIDVVADNPADSDLHPSVLAEISNLVHETGAAYASRHYHVYHFLLTLSDLAGGEGLEHGQSSDNGVGELGFSDERHQNQEADLLSHEFTHSWNGKYRRPATLYQPDFATPMQGELLWVYEGMTQYMGNVLAARSGLETQATYRDKLAASYASLDSKGGRLWRTTDDTAIASSISRRPGPAWANLKRGQDYYQEGELLWLDADTLIRKLTNGQKSLTDFQHIFLGKGGNTGPLIVPYDRAELIADLNQVVPYDWAAFLHTRIDEINPHADAAGIEQGGYKVVYVDHPSNAERGAPTGARGPMGPNVWYSLGLRLGAENTVADVRLDSAADKARLSPGDKLIAVNGRIASADTLGAAIKAAQGTTEPIHFIVQNETYVRNVDVDYHDGERYPTLQRVEGAPDLLDEITKPLSPLTVLPKQEHRQDGDDDADRPARQGRPAATN